MAWGIVVYIGYLNIISSPHMQLAATDGWHPRNLVMKPIENTRITLCSILKSESNTTSGCPKLNFWQSGSYSNIGEGGPKHFMLIFNGKEFKAGYEELFIREDDERHCNISMKKITLTSAGKYECTETREFNVTSYFAELIVLGNFSTVFLFFSYGLHKYVQWVYLPPFVHD